MDRQMEKTCNADYKYGWPQKNRYCC